MFLRVCLSGRPVGFYEDFAINVVNDKETFLTFSKADVESSIIGNTIFCVCSFWYIKQIIKICWEKIAYLLFFSLHRQFYHFSKLICAFRLMLC